MYVPSPSVHHLSSLLSVVVKGPQCPVWSLAHTCRSTMRVCAAEDGGGHIEDIRGMSALQMQKY